MLKVWSYGDWFTYSSLDKCVHIVFPNIAATSDVVCPHFFDDSVSSVKGTGSKQNSNPQILYHTEWRNGADWKNVCSLHKLHKGHDEEGFVICLSEIDANPNFHQTRSTFLFERSQSPYLVEDD